MMRRKLRKSSRAAARGQAASQLASALRVAAMPAPAEVALAEATVRLHAADAEAAAPATGGTENAHGTMARG